jgi:hypothetical protein
VAAEAVRVTEVPDAYEAEHVAPQLMPAGLLVTVPEPDLETVRVYEVVTFCVNVAVTLRAWVMETVQLPVPEQPPPLQPVKL